MTNNELDNIASTLSSLQELSGSNDKKAYLKANCGGDEIKYLLTVLLDSKYSLGLKKLGKIGVSSKTTIRTFSELKTLIEKMLNSNMSDKLRGEVIMFLGGCSIDTQDVLKALLQKTLKLGVTSKSYSEVFKGEIQEHPIALAKSPNEAVPSLPCIVGTKYDGIRYTQLNIIVTEDIVTLGNALTRDRNIMRFKRINEGIKQLLKGYIGEWVIDGELETLDEDFSKVQGAVTSNVDGGVIEDGNNLKLTVFDLIRVSDYLGETKSKPQAERIKEISKLFLINKPTGLVEAEHITVYSIEKIKELTDLRIAQGLEGTIIKDPKASYKKGKTSAWIKQKSINDCTLKCIGTTEGTNKREGKVGALMMESKDGLIKVNVGSGLTDEMVELFTKNPPIGKFFDVLFNVVSQADNGQMSLRLPRLKGLRVDVTEADDFAKIKSQHAGKMMLKEA